LTHTWLLGDKNAISPTAEQGYQLFKSLGGSACHNGLGASGDAVCCACVKVPFSLHRKKRRYPFSNKPY